MSLKQGLMKREQLRLRMERASIEKAKRFAREHGISVSSMVADFLRPQKNTLPGPKVWSDHEAPT
jgi:hypothetical protein